MPQVSVLMPVYNGADYIAEAIDSIIGQSFSDWELIIGDDGSTDNTGEIINAYIDKDNRISLCKNTENRGVSYTRKLLLEKAQGEYIAFLDSDDIALPNKLQLQVDFLDSHPDYVLCGTWGTMIDSNGKKIKQIKLANGYDSIRCSLLFSSQFIQSSILIRKAIFVNESYNPDFWVAEDYDLWCRFSAARYKMENITKPLVKYRWHDANTSSAMQEKITSFTKTIFKRELISLAIYADDEELDIHLALRDKSVQAIPDKDFLVKANSWLIKLGGSNQLCRTYNHDIFRATICFRWIFACKERKAFRRILDFPTPMNFKVWKELLCMLFVKV
ncbi:glycosyltransferase family 2 protein [Viscerimonas tarda]